MKNKKASFPSFIYMVLFVLLMYPALKAVNSGNYFEVKRIEIDGNRKFMKVLNKFKGMDLRSLAEDEIIEELKRDNMVKEVIVKKVFPHTLIVKIKERKPVACYISSRDQYTIDSDGRAFLKGCMDGLIVLKSSEVPIGFQLDFVKDKHYLGDDCEWVDFVSPFSINLKFKGFNYTVMLPVENFEDKYREAKRILPLLSGIYTFSYADFRAENKIYLGRKK